MRVFRFEYPAHLRLLYWGTLQNNLTMENSIREVLAAGYLFRQKQKKRQEKIVRAQFLRG